ncbi:MAG: hypothetical protein J6V11_05770, partial [Alphaproteobacteria bacterium]|nr:hypothetical protein [Alphaproteobacteria bacterium]
LLYSVNNNTNMSQYNCTIVLAHIGIVIYGVKEPHLSNMMQASGPMLSPSKNVYRSRGNKLAP